MLNNKTEQTGRSMVEMLGVLAVIGVLSITGITSYTTAMNKHKANEILDAASKRAVAVSTQIQRGKTDPTLDEFETNTVQGATFGTPVKVGDNQFKLPVTWASDTAKTTIGAQIKNIAGDGTGTVLIDSDVTRFLYNNDLSNGVSNTNNRDTNDATKCASGYKGTDCDSCDTGYGMHDGNCVACSTVGATGTTSDVPATGYTGCYCTSDQTWENNECTTPAPACIPACTGDRSCVNGVCLCNETGKYWNGTSCATCPNDGSVGSDGTTCCNVCVSDSFDGQTDSDKCAWTGEAYDDFLNTVCGCAKGGSAGSDGTTCCSDNLAWYDGNQDYSAAAPSVCGGCPNGGRLGTDNVTCCLGDLGWENNFWDYAEALVACGCPDEGQPEGNNSPYCIKNGCRWTWYGGEGYYDNC